MKWRPAPPEMVKLFEAVVPAVPKAERRKMFGYPCLFSNGYLFAGLHQESFMLRLSPADYTAFMKIEGAKPFEPMPGHHMNGYVTVPPTMLQSSTELKSWLKKAFAGVQSLPPKAAKAKPARRK